LDIIPWRCSRDPENEMVTQVEVLAMGISHSKKFALIVIIGLFNDDFIK
jgi:hypothetical protein